MHFKQALFNKFSTLKDISAQENSIKFNITKLPTSYMNALVKVILINAREIKTIKPKKKHIY